jgi:deoxyribodipyrimidine photo-lyase
LFEPSVFKRHPVEQKNIEFALDLAENIPGIKVLIAEFSDLQKQLNPEKIIFKEHPLSTNYKGQVEPREWMYSVHGYFPSFFAFWKKCKKELRS